MSEEVTFPAGESLLPTERPADNSFFEDPVDDHPRGESWETEIDGLRATLGRIEAGTTVRHQIEEPEIILVHSGEVAVRMAADLERGIQDLRYPYHPFHRPLAFALPLGEAFELSVTAKADQKVVEGEEPADLTYTCFYPKNEAEQKVAERYAHTHGFHVLGYTMHDTYWRPEDHYRRAAS